MTDQLARLDALIAAAWSARDAARKEMLFASNEGQALCWAAFDLFEVEGLHTLHATVAREVRADGRRAAA